MSDSVRPHRQQPTRFPHPWDSPGKNTGVGCHFLLQCMKVKSESEIAQSCPTLCNSMDCSLPGSSVHGIFQARVLEWGATAFSDTINHNHRQLANLIRWTTALSNSMKLSHSVWGHLRRMSHGGEVGQNVVHWRRQWQTTSVFLP